MSPTPPSPPAELLAGLRAHPLPPVVHEDKHGRGTTLVIGGSAATPGAVVLAGRAALRAGAGRLRIVTDPGVAVAVAVAVPEARVGTWDDVDELGIDADAVVLGPGLIDDDLAATTLTTVAGFSRPRPVVVLDALAIGALGSDERSRAELRDRLVLTPNRSELDRLAGERDPHVAAGRVASQLRAAVVSFDVVAAPDGALWVDPIETAGLGTSGAGDVLAGIVGGFAAITGDATTAACWGGAVHRRAAQAAAGRIAPLGYLASDLADAVPAVTAGLRAELGSRDGPRP
jgi:ADP-dependent NAD(P)H-hydrate dehydratase